MGFIAPARPGNRYSLFRGTTDAVVGGAVTFCQWPAVLHSFNQIRVSDVGHTKCHQIQLIIFQSLLCDITGKTAGSDDGAFKRVAKTAAEAFRKWRFGVHRLIVKVYVGQFPLTERVGDG